MSAQDEIRRLQRKLDYRTATLDVVIERLGEAMDENKALKEMLKAERDEVARLRDTVSIQRGIINDLREASSSALDYTKVADSGSIVLKKGKAK